uniref:Candidate secreted effector n=1 Tax=Meloidogyne incognita TaxID=6306 RepID=A0A914LZ43_MELIC
MVSKDRKNREKERAALKKRRSDSVSVSSAEVVPEKRLNVERDDQSSINPDVFTAPTTPTHSHSDISEIVDDKMEQNKRGRPCKKRREGSGRKPENVDPVSHASEDFENEVVQGICRELDIDSIENSSQTSISFSTLRRSTRHSSTISRFSGISFDDKWPSNRPITHNC